MSSRLPLAVVLATILGPLLPAPAGAAPGDLDESFGDGGRVTTTFTGDHDFARAVAIQADGKIVAAGTGGFGRFAVVPLQPRRQPRPVLR